MQYFMQLVEVACFNLGGLFLWFEHES